MCLCVELQIGSGAYGTVYRGQLIRENNKTIAVKRIDSEGTDDQGEVIK